MAIFKLSLLDPSKHSRYDVFDSFVVRAPDPRTAREMVILYVGNRDAGIWLDLALTECRWVAPEGEPKILLSFYNAG